MKEFIIEDNLSKDEIKSIKTFIDNIKKISSEESSAFCGYPYFDGRNENAILKCGIVNKKGIFVLTFDGSDFKLYKRFIKKILFGSERIADIIEEQDIIFEVKADFINELNEIKQKEDILDEGDIVEINSLFQNAFSLIKPDNRMISREGSIGYYIKKRSEEIANFDETQFDGIYKKVINHQRIRGLAGSGKTIVLVKKMAYIHFKNKSANLCYVFYTISLKQYIMKLFHDFYKELDPSGEPDYTKVNIMHCWGGKYNEGFYSKMCNECGIEPLKYSIGNSIEGVANHLLKSLKYNINLYDFVFLDEAQDFRIGFFRLALKSLKENGKLIYAYDEMQTLDEKNDSVPTKNEIFGSDECDDINLKRCYRTPKEILVTAHALGLGIYRDEDNPIVNMIEDIKVWESIGYEVIDGNLNYGKQVTLQRKPVYENMIKDPIRFKKFKNSSEEYKYVTLEIKKLIEEEEVLPEDILIIDLDDKNIKGNSRLFKETYYEELENNSNFFIDGEWIKNINVVDKDNPKLFKLENSIAYTTIYRAKGNEANIVFILNSDSLSTLASTSRNQLFTAMTRSKFIVYILDATGTTNYDVEIDKVKKYNYTLSFVYPTKSQMEKIRTNSKAEISAIKSMDNAVKSYKEAIDYNKELEVQLLLKQTGKENIDELLNYLNDLKDRKDE